MGTITDDQSKYGFVVEKLLSEEQDATLLEALRFLEWSFRQTLSGALREASDLETRDPMAGRSWCLLFATVFTAAPVFIDSLGQLKGNGGLAAVFVALSVLIAVTIRAWDDHRVGYALRRVERSRAIRRIAYMSMAKWDSALATCDKDTGGRDLQQKLDSILREFRLQLTDIATAPFSTYEGNSRSAPANELQQLGGVSGSGLSSTTLSQSSQKGSAG